jgi:hypothetical protein
MHQHPERPLLPREDSPESFLLAVGVAMTPKSIKTALFGWHRACEREGGQKGELP